MNLSISKSIFLFFFFLSILGAGILGVCVSFVHYSNLNISILENSDHGKPSILLDDNGHEWGRFAHDKRETISYEQIPLIAIQAFIAAEDHNFFNHYGVSYKGIVRSILANLYNGRIMQGASTITQQLVKLLFFDSKKTFSRKCKELVHAILLEYQLTKEQILQLYLNNVCFGCGIYGIEAASQRFWGKHSSQLTISQAATLAAIVQAPSKYCPLLFPLSAKRRRNVVLHSMLRLKFIDKGMLDNALQEPLNLIKQEDQLACHVKETLRVWLENLVGKEHLYKGGLLIQTTLNRKLQIAAQEEFLNHITTLRKTINDGVDGGLLSVEVKTGDIKALVGGIGFPFNRALQAKRQLGSIFKPLIYACAAMKGRSFNECEYDEPLELFDGTQMWAPKNSTNKFKGIMTLARALAQSNNIVSIKVLLDVGIPTVINLAQKCHISNSLPPYPSLALGCVDVSLQQAAGMFNVFANGGIYQEPHLVLWIKDRWGNKIWKYNYQPEHVMHQEISDQIIGVLSNNLKKAQMRWKDEWILSEAFGKTGTTNDSKTCWFVGSTPSLTTAIYVGRDDNNSLGENIFASSTAFPIWLRFMRKIDTKKEAFFFAPTLERIFVHGAFGTLSSYQDPEALSILVAKNKNIARVS